MKLSEEEVKKYLEQEPIQLGKDAKDLTGKKYGRGVVIKPIFRKYNKNKTGTSIYYLLKCECGTYYKTTSNNLKSGNTTSCGCYHKECISKNAKNYFTRQKIAATLRTPKAKNSLAEKYPESIERWNYNKNIKTPYEVNCSSAEKYFFICKKCQNSYLCSCNHFINGRRCPYCCKSPQKVLLEFNDLKTINPEWLIDWDYEANKLGPENYTQSSGKQIWCKCHICGWKWLVRIYTRTKGHGCLQCNKSKLEKETAQILNKFNIKYEQEYNKFGIIGTGGGLLRFDFYLPDYNTIIECQGIQHYDENKWYDKKSSLITQKHDKIKRKYAKKNNIKLIEIPYTDFDNIDKILINNLKLENNNEN